jgi:hypothetical protein
LDFAIRRDVDEDGEGVLRYRRIVPDEQFQVLDRLELVALEEGDVGLRVADEMVNSCIV